MNIGEERSEKVVVKMLESVKGSPVRIAGIDEDEPGVTIKVHPSIAKDFEGDFMGVMKIND